MPSASQSTLLLPAADHPIMWLFATEDAPNPIALYTRHSPESRQERSGTAESLTWRMRFFNEAQFAPPTDDYTKTVTILDMSTQHLDDRAKELGRGKNIAFRGEILKALRSTATHTGCTAQRVKQSKTWSLWSAAFRLAIRNLPRSKDSHASVIRSKGTVAYFKPCVTIRKHSATR